MAAKRAELVLVCVVGLVLGACASKARIGFVPSGPSYQARQGSCDIEVFMESKPDRPYEELGTINYHDERHRTAAGGLNIETVLPEIRRRACEVGADALVNVHVTDERRLEWAMFHVSATAIRFRQR